VQADAATATPDGKFVDVFATSTGEQLQVEPLKSGGVATPMLHDPKSDRFYARLSVGADPLPANLTVTNIADKPASQSTVAVKTPTGLTISKAEFDGTNHKLNVTATSTTPTDVLTVTGYGDLASGAGSWDTVSPPATVEVKTGTRSVTAPVTIANGVETPAQPPITPTQPPVEPPTGGGTGTGTAPAAPANLKATPGATNVALAWDAVPGATKYQVTAYDATGKALGTQPVSTATTTQNVVGLAVNTSYQFTVKATTAAGTSAESTPKVGTKTVVETVSITSARWKNNDFRVVGTSTATGGTVNVYAANPGTGPTAVGTPLAGMANIPLTTAAPGTAFDARVRTGVPPRPAQVWVRTSNGAVTGPFTVS
jgi:Fibronectin type III domain